jgi:hypothetical protein
MRIKIGVHAGFGAPGDAIERLAAKLGPAREDARFTLTGDEIAVRFSDDAPVSMESDEREEIGRAAVLEMIGEVCERSPDLKFDWYAVSARRY